MKTIDDLLRMYDQVESRKEDVVIKAKLRLINSLFQEIESSDDRLFLEEIIDSFGEIIKLQQSVIEDLNTAMDFGNPPVSGAHFVQNSVTCPPQQFTGFDNDRQLQEAFSAYLTCQTKKPLSSYTVNDYCSRIRNLWKNFYKAYQQGALPDGIQIPEDSISPENPLINAFHHGEDLDFFIMIMAEQNPGEKRNWANISAAFNKFQAFIASMS